MSSADVHILSAKPMPRVALGVAAAIVIAILVNTGIAALTSSLDHDGPKTGLMLIAYGPLTALGVLAGTAGWAAVRRLSSRPRTVLRALVPAVVALTFIPGLIFMITGTSSLNIVGLWVMHLVVAFTTVPILGRVLPLRDKNT